MNTTLGAVGDLILPRSKRIPKKRDLPPNLRIILETLFLLVLRLCVSAPCDRIKLLKKG